MKVAKALILCVWCLGCGGEANNANNTNNVNNSNNANNANNSNNANNVNNSNNANNVNNTNNVNNSNNLNCIEEEIRLSSTACGFNDRGFLEEVCVDGNWEATTNCQDPDMCTNLDVRPGTAPCGLFGTGFFSDECINGLWTESEMCDDPTVIELVADLNPNGDGRPLLVDSDAGFDGGDSIIGKYADRVVFNAWDEDSRGMWVSDGTTAGTIQLADYGVDSVNVYGAIQFTNTFVMGYQTGLWATDGTLAGTTQLFGNLLYNQNGSSSWIHDGHNVGLFFADNGLGDRHIYYTDGTVNGTMQHTTLGTTGELMDAVALPSLNRTFYLQLTGGGATFISCFDGTNSVSLDWIDDVSSIHGVEHGGMFYFSSSPVGDSNRELWRTDCTAGGTRLVKDLNPAFGSSPVAFFDFGANFLFSASTQAGRGLFRSDGTDAGTVLVRQVDPGTLYVIGQRAYFSAQTQFNGREPWVTDGTTAGTIPLGDLNPGATNSMFGGKFAEMGGFVYFVAQTGALHLWRTDGTPGGTEQVSQARATDFHVVGDRILFLSYSPQAGRELWVTDGTPFTEQPLPELNPGPADGVVSFGRGLYQLPNAILFAGDNGTTGVELFAIRY